MNFWTILSSEQAGHLMLGNIVKTAEKMCSGKLDKSAEIVTWRRENRERVAEV